MSRPFVELRELEPGQHFMFAAEDLEFRGPCTLVKKNAGSATIDYAPHEIVKRFRTRNRKTGEMIEREIKQTVSGHSYCALGAQVVLL